ncbi:zinc-binding alcohol dehydrogenase [Actinomycetospora corticicola]|uniref:Threonine dehydrogenase-like Zn-dependent dehydrogenase n=1 Tax=Actinomycetospora corticicola TaxID=663602 RepID=A0A7Y9DV91_9PSEU|nr:threonine dehydrogenase-like Zn-dependent dehydrogenase [Actinomycetospora corticicola]
MVDVDLPDPGPDDVVVRTRWSAISRGTELLVYRGGVPAGQAERMRAPFQVGDFPGPVTYGYLAVGVVESGPAELVGRDVFCLHPHQTRFVVPASAVSVVPDDVPAGRAVLTGTVETAVNALWDAGPRVGDRIAVVGAGMVGCSVAALLATIPGVRVELVDVDASRASVAAALGVGFAAPADALGDCDLVFHTSATSAGLARSLELLGVEGEVIEMSWYGDREVSVPLGEGFHAGRLAVRSSQVGMVSGARRARRTYADRMALALRLLADDRFEAIVTDTVPFETLPETMARLAAGAPGLAVRVDYGGA